MAGELPAADDELDTEALILALALLLAVTEAETGAETEAVAGRAALLLAFELLPELDAVELALVLACGTWLVSIDSSAELAPEQGSSASCFTELFPAMGDEAVGSFICCSGDNIAADLSCSRVSSLRTRPLRRETVLLLISGVSSSFAFRFMAKWLLWGSWW